MYRRERQLPTAPLRLVSSQLPTAQQLLPYKHPDDEAMRALQGSDVSEARVRLQAEPKRGIDQVLTVWLVRNNHTGPSILHPRARHMCSS